MAIDLPSGCHLQPTGGEGVSGNGDTTNEYVALGAYDALKEFADYLRQGDEVDTGWLAHSWNLQHDVGGLGTLTITCVSDAGKDYSNGPGVDKPIKDVWKIHAVRNDVSVMAYCDPNNSPSLPSRVIVEKWLRETDSATAAAGDFRENGEVVNVAGTYPGSYALIKKMMKGAESVIRFYPAITRVRTYAQPPPDCLDNVGLVDDPPTSSIAGDGSIDAKHPKGLAAKLAKYEWLKMQDDCDETSDGKWTRTESWWGILKGDSGDGHPWDPDFYGHNRWHMPCTPEDLTNNNNGNNNGGNA